MLRLRCMHGRCLGRCRGREQRRWSIPPLADILSPSDQSKYCWQQNKTFYSKYEKVNKKQNKTKKPTPKQKTNKRKTIKINKNKLITFPQNKSSRCTRRLQSPTSLSATSGGWRCYSRKNVSFLAI